MTLQELEEAAELACANLLDSVKYMRILTSSLPQSDVDVSFQDWLSALSRKVKLYFVDNDLNIVYLIQVFSVR